MYQSLYTEQELLSSLAKGERTATEYVYKEHSKIIISWIQNNAGSESDAEDVFQEAMIILYEKVQQEDFRLTCKIGTYLFAVSKYIWYKKLQKQQKQPSSLFGNEDNNDWAYEEDIKSHNEREAHYNQLDTSLEQLGEPCRSLLKAFYHKDKSMQEIAKDFGYTNPDNAKTQKYKCLNRLRKLFYGAQVK